MHYWVMSTRNQEAPPTDFDGWFAVAEPRLRQALVAAFGHTIGRDATLDAVAYAWENFDHVIGKENSIGYVYGVGRNLARRSVNRRPFELPPVEPTRTPEVEPGLPDAVAALPERQRMVVILLYGYDWTMSEVAELLGIAKTTVQNHAERGLRSLRADLGVLA